MNIPSILAPVGGQEQLLAAVRCGADAVYLGTKDFNARRNASNFDDMSLANAARYCRERGVKLYVTVNTMVLDSELPALEAAADLIAAAGADGVILQDMAAARLFHRRYPGILRIASTQTAVHNIDGARFLRDAGFDSFVLARELALEEIAAICASVDLPAEAFVHGAHCMSVSGMCTLSSVLGGRSGNRGLCAQPCRLGWRCGQNDHALSLKDMSLLRHIPALAEAGVRQLKIEGRMKRPEYVAAAVTACRAARDGEAYDEETLRAVFSRSGFTDGYLTGRRDKSMFGYRTKEDVTGADAVLGTLRGLYRRERQNVPVDLSFTLTGENSSLSVSDGTHTVTVTGPLPEQAVNRPLDALAAEKNLSKTGGTQYYVNQFRADISAGLTLPAAALNAMRRDALAAMDEARGAFICPAQEDVSPWEQIAPIVRLKDRSNGAPPLWARFCTKDAMPETDALERVILPLHDISEEIITCFGDRLTAELPPVCFPEDEPKLFERVSALRGMGLRELWADNIGGIMLGRRLDMTVRGGFGLNVANTAAAQAYAEQGLASLTASFEVPMGAARDLASPVPCGLAVYGQLPLMRWRNCPLRANLGCSACGGKGTLTDRRNISFPVECGQKRFSSLLNSVPLDTADRDMPGDFRLLWFTRESGAEAAAVIGRFLRGEKNEAPHTGGLYYRKLL